MLDTMLSSARNYLKGKRAALGFGLLARAHPLRYLFLEITRRCNLACVYCGSDCSPRWQGQELSADEWIEVVRQVAVDFDARQVMVAVMGGEPLIVQGVYDLLDELGRLGFPFGIVSNGARITENNAHRLVRSGIRSISLSLDAPAEINDTLRGQGSAAYVERAVANLHQAGYDGKLEIISSITRPAVPYLDDMRRYVARLRVPLWRLVPIFSVGRAALCQELIPNADDLRIILEFVERGRKDGHIPKPEFGEESYLGCKERAVRPFDFQCRAGITVGGIAHDGAIGACPEISRDFVQGNIRRERFKTVWEQRYQVFRDRSWTRRGICAECKAFDVCQGGSLHLYADRNSGIGRCFYDMLRDELRAPSPGGRGVSS